MSKVMPGASREAGLPPLAIQAQQESPLQSRPPQEGDGNFLLEAFLRARLPAGGRLHMFKRPSPASTAVYYNDFIQFLQQEHPAHPYTQWWLSKLQRPRPLTACFTKNLPVLRDSRWMTHRGCRRPALQVGGPGSALQDPFLHSNKQTCLPVLVSDRVKNREGRRKAVRPDETVLHQNKKD